jgi:hypothetical protein
VAIQKGGVTWRGDEVTGLFRAAAVVGLGHAGEHIRGEADRIIPLDEGTLLRSGGVFVDEDDLVVTIAYDTPYAVRQHEELDWRHAPGRYAKYLETPLHTEADTAQALIAAPIRRATR